MTYVVMNVLNIALVNRKNKSAGLEKDGSMNNIFNDNRCYFASGR